MSIKQRSLISFKKRAETREYDEFPTTPTQNSPRTLSNNGSYYGMTTPSNASNTGNVKVVCRVRPCNQREIELGAPVAVNIEDEKTISVKSSQYYESGANGLTFTFDRIFDMESAQSEIYDFVARPVVESVLEGFNGTVFAYGQTSSGKTYTMMGPDIEDPELCGVIPRMVTTVFDYISDTPDHIEFTVKVSMVEIYMERIRDLLNPKKVNLKVREDKSKGIYIEDVTESYVSEENDVYDFLKYGHSNRATTVTNMNETSSRSHCIFMMTIHQNNLLEMHAKTGKLYLVDLAGSEKVGKTGAVGQVLEEAKEINKSLSALGNVINALTDLKGHQHIPYRDSKLTRILQESLGGNSRTSLIINCSPSAYNENETISALRFGYRAKSIKNTPKINREYTAAQLQVLLEKAEKEIALKDKKIKFLEDMLYDNGISLPKDYQDIESSPKKQNSRLAKTMEEAEEGFDGYSDKEDESGIKLDLPSPIRTAKNNQDKIRALEDELRIERLNLNKQTEKVKLLKKDLAENNVKTEMIEKENEALINKLAIQAIKMQEMEEKIKDKEMKLEILQLLKDILMTENEELKKSKKSFIQELDEENAEVMQLAQEKGLLTKNSNNRSHTERSILTDKELEKKRELPNGFLDNIMNDMVQEMAQKLNIKNLQMAKDLTIPYLEKLKQAFQGESDLVANKKSQAFPGIGTEIKKKFQSLKEELALEKQKNLKMKNDYEAFTKEHDNLAKNNIPSFEEWKQGIVTDNSVDNKDETIIFKDFMTKKKEAKGGNNLDSFKDKKAVSKLTETTEISVGYNDNLATPKILSSENVEPKSPVKTQRMINLEKQLHETKELVNQYKNKIDSLKFLITANSSTTQVKTEPPEKIENTESFKQQKQSIKQEVLNQVTCKEKEAEKQAELSPRSAANARIVKPIKGGQQKPTSIASQKFFDILKQQYRFNRHILNGIGGEGVLNKQKQQTNAAPKSSTDLKSKAV